MRFRFLWTAIVLIQLFHFTRINAQLKIVVIGSSTAAGVGASDRTNLGWVGLLRTYYQQNPVGGQTVSTINLAVGGTNTRDGLPGTSTGITAALGYNPDIVLVNYPSNDIAQGISKEETLANLQTIYNTAIAAQVRCFISTSQPRNFSEFPLRQIQFELRNDIMNTFGVFALNFWDSIATDDDAYQIRSEYAGNPQADPDDPPDGIHLNDAGHMVLFNIVKAKDIFSVALPVVWGDISATRRGSSVELNWSTLTEKNNGYFLVQRSWDARSFSDIGKVSGKENSATVQHYLFVDKAPGSGIDFYRLAQVDIDGMINYSKIVSTPPANPNLESELYPSPAVNMVFISISSRHATHVSATIYDLSGRRFIVRDLPVNEGMNTLRIPVGNLCSGLYCLKLQGPDWTVTRKFVKN